MRRLLLHPWYPLAFQVLMTALLAAVVGFLFFGPPQDELNLGSYLLWYFWWASLPLSFILLGRMWCAICPVSFLSDAAQKAAPWASSPPPFLRRFDLAILTGAFLTVHALNLWFNFEENLAPGRMFVMVLLALSLVLAVTFRKRVWCRVCCPLGAMAALLSGLSPLRVRSRATLCRSQCGGKVCLEGLDGRGGCPLLERPEEQIDPRFCNLCGECLKVCPHDSCRTEWLPIGRFFRPDAPSWQDSAAVLLLLGVAVDSGLKHLNNWPVMFWRTAVLLNVAPGALLELSLHAMVILVPFLVMALLAWTSGGRKGLRERMSILAFPALPLAAAAVVGISLRPLLIAGPLNLRNILHAGGWRGFTWLDAVRHLDGWPLRTIQFMLIGGGLFWAFREARGEHRALGNARTVGTIAGIPAYVFFAGIFFWIFSQRMIT